MKDKLFSVIGALLAAAGAAPTWTTAGVLAVLGLAGGAVATVAATWLAPVLIALSLALLGRSFYVIYVRRRASRASTVITWLSAVFVVGYWTWRLL